MASDRVFARSDVQYVREKMEAEVRPFVSFVGDLGDWTFNRQARLDVPAMIDILVRSEGAYCDFMIDIRSGSFIERHDMTWEVRISAEDGELLGTCRFWKWYAQHQVIIPLWKFYRSNTALHISAVPLAESATDGPSPVFRVSTLYTDQKEMWRTLEQMSIWVFSTARSGSTWLAQDILGWGHRTRLVDESGVGRMFAPLDWDPEHFYRVDQRPFHFESGLEYEIGSRNRSEEGVPPFERSFRNLRRELQILNHTNFDLYHKLLKDCTLSQVLNEWGVRSYNRLVFKLPNDSHGADFIMRAFPLSHMVFLMRDGRDVMRSRFSPFASPILAETRDPELRRFAIAYFAHFWNFEVDIIRSAYDAHDPELRHFLRYEDARLEPEKTIKILLDRLNMPLAPNDLAQLVADVTLENMPESSRGPDKARQDGKIGGFRNQFSPEEVALMNSIMRDNLVRYGYDVD